MTPRFCGSDGEIKGFHFAGDLSCEGGEADLKRREGSSKVQMKGGPIDKSSAASRRLDIV